METLGVIIKMLRVRLMKDLSLRHIEQGIENRGQGTEKKTF
jgi:hypothetical protein